MNDYIDRQAAIDAIERLILPQTNGETMAEEINRVAWRCAINCAEEMIGHLPSIEPVKHGRWENDFCSFVCSACGGRISDSALDDYSEPRYCPNCGAQMDKEEGEEA